MHNLHSYESLTYPDEIQISDINTLSKEYPTLITLDFNLHNIIDISNTFTTSKG